MSQQVMIALLRGVLAGLCVVPFAAWFIGSPLAFGDYPTLLFSGLLCYFGNAAVAMPFLLDLMRLPADMFQIFLLTGVYCGRMSDALGAMDMFTFAALVARASSGMLRIQWRRVVLILAEAVVVFLVAIVGVRTYLSYAIGSFPNPATNGQARRYAAGPRARASTWRP